ATLGGAPEFVIGSSTKTDLIVDSNGALGLGTTSPNIYFTGAGSTSAGGNPGILLQGDVNNSRSLEIHNNYATGIDVFSHSNTTFRGPTISLYHSGGTINNPTTVQNGFQLGYLNFGGYDGASYGSSGATIQATADENWTTSAHGTRIDFQIARIGMTAVVEPLLIASSARIGVGGAAGTSTPWGLLSVNPSALGSGVPEFVVGSSTKTHFVIDGGGNVGIGT